MHFRPNLLLGLQRHDNELTVPSRVKHLAKIFILDSDGFNVLHETFHSNSFFVILPQRICLMTPKIMRAGIAGVCSMFRTQGVDLDDRLGRSPQLEFPA
jgi:aspartyl/asparaginyl-tRNA synthetase